MTIDEFIDLVSGQFLDLSEPLNRDTHFHEVPSWDSMTALAIVEEVKSNCGVVIDLQQMKRAVTIEDLYKLVMGKQLGGKQGQSEVEEHHATLADLAISTYGHEYEDRFGFLSQARGMLRTLHANPFVADAGKDLCVLWASKQGIVFGGNVNLPGEINVHGTVYKTLVSSNTFVAEDFRSTGFGLELWERCVVRAPHGLVSASSCSQMKVKLSQSTNCTVFLFPRYVMLSKSRSVVEQKVKGAAGKLLSVIADCALMVYWMLIGLYARIKTFGLQISRVKPDDEDALAAVEAIVLSEQKECQEVHDRKWFKWMMSESFSKDGPNELFVVKTHGKVVAFVMMKKRFHDHASHRGYKNVWLGSIMEWGAVLPYKKKIPSLLIRLAVKLRPKVDAVEILATESDVEVHLRHLLWRHVGDGNFIFKLSATSPLKTMDTVLKQENWRLRPAMGDAGLI